MNSKAITRLKRRVTVGFAGGNSRWVPAMHTVTRVADRAVFLSNVPVFAEL
jgi:hypothetical protein